MDPLSLVQGGKGSAWVPIANIKLCGVPRVTHMLFIRNKVRSGLNACAEGLSETLSGISDG